MSNTPTPDSPIPNASNPQEKIPDKTEVVKKTSSKKILFMVILGLGFSCIVIILIVVLLLGMSIVPTTVNVSKDPSEETEEEVTSDTVTPVVIAESDNKIFYVEAHNIYSYDVNTKVKVKLTNYPAGADSLEDIRSVRVVDGDTLGFGMCKTVVGDFDCGVFVLDLNTKIITEKIGLDPDFMLLDVGFYSTNKFAYLMTSELKWQVILSDAGTSEVLEDIGGGAYGRGGFKEDSEKIKFSSDGKYMLQISTSSPKNSMDFKIYIYNLIDGTEDVVQKATQPAWLDENTIVYRMYDSNDATGASNGLGTYEVDTKVSKKVAGLDSDIYNPSVLTGTNKIVFTKYNANEVWMYDLDSDTETRISESAQYGYWANKDKVIYTVTELCAEECMGDFNIISANVFDITDSTIEALPIEVDIASSATSRFR